MSNVAYIYGNPKTRTLEDTSCCVCGIIFAVPAEFLRERRENKGAHYHCPNGHSLVFTETEVDRLKRQLDAEKKRVERAENNAREAKERANRLERSNEAYKGHLTRVKKRVGHGVCPCCKRIFKQLAAHMKTKHPEYNEGVNDE